MPLIHLARIAFAALAKAQRLPEEDLSGSDANANFTETEIDKPGTLVLEEGLRLALLLRLLSVGWVDALLCLATEMF